MKISATNPARGSAIRRGAKTTGAGGQDFADHLEIDATATAPTGQAKPITTVDALIALQEVPDATVGHKSAIRRGHDLLDELDEIRHGLLLGAIPLNHLRRLADQLHQRRAATVDPGLTEIIQEIELRVAVEHAKLSM